MKVSTCITIMSFSNLWLGTKDIYQKLIKIRTFGNDHSDNARLKCHMFIACSWGTERFIWRGWANEYNPGTHFNSDRGKKSGKMSKSITSGTDCNRSPTHLKFSNALQKNSYQTVLCFIKNILFRTRYQHGTAGARVPYCIRTTARGSPRPKYTALFSAVNGHVQPDALDWYWATNT